MTSGKIETIDSLINHIRKYVAAYRKSYRLCRKVYISLQIISGLIGCGAVAAIVPAVPIYVVITGVIPAGITVLLNKTQLKEKEALFKGCHWWFKQLLSEIQMKNMQTDIVTENLIRKTFAKILQLEREATYVVPFEKYMKRYNNLNGVNKSEHT